MPGMDVLMDWVNVSVMAAITVIFLWAVMTYINKLLPVLNDIKQNTSESQTMISNNTQAFHELSKSNENVAKALELLTRTLDSQAEAMTRHETLAERNFERAFDILGDHTEAIQDLNKAIIRVNEKVSMCTDLQQMKIYNR